MESAREETASRPAPALRVGAGGGGEFSHLCYSASFCVINLVCDFIRLCTSGFSNGNDLLGLSISYPKLFDCQCLWVFGMLEVIQSWGVGGLRDIILQATKQTEFSSQYDTIGLYFPNDKSS